MEGEFVIAVFIALVAVIGALGTIVCAIMDRKNKGE